MPTEAIIIIIIIIPAFLTCLAFNPRDLYYRGTKIIIIIILLCFYARGFILVGKNNNNSHICWYDDSHSIADRGAWFCQIIDVISRQPALEPLPSPLPVREIRPVQLEPIPIPVGVVRPVQLETMPTPVVVREVRPPVQQQHQQLRASAIPVRRRPSLTRDVDRQASSLQPPQSQHSSSASISGVDAATEMPLWHLKYVFKQATMLDREIRMLRKPIDPESRQELTSLINFCRERIAQADRSSAAAANHVEGPPQSPDHVRPDHLVKPSAGTPTSSTTSIPVSTSRPSFLRPPSVRASGDASSRFRPQLWNEPGNCSYPRLLIPLITTAKLNSDPQSPILERQPSQPLGVFQWC